MDAASSQLNQKRDRSKNYTRDEDKMLADLVSKCSDRVNAKGAEHVKTRDGAWTEIATAFNAACPSGIMRPKEKLQKRWVNMTNTAKKELAARKRDRQATGGGTAEVPRLSDLTKQVIDAAGPTMHPQPNPFDDDAGYHDEELGIKELDSDIVMLDEGAVVSDGGTTSITAAAGVRFATPKSTKFFYKKRSETRIRKPSVAVKLDSMDGQSLMDMKREQHEWLREEHDARMVVLAMEKEYHEKRLQLLSQPAIISVSSATVDQESVVE